MNYEVTFTLSAGVMDTGNPKTLTYQIVAVNLIQAVITGRDRMHACQPQEM